MLKDQINKVYDSNKMNIVILGDFNIYYYQDQTNIYKKILVSIEKVFLIRQVIESPTRCSEQRDSPIDLIFTNYIKIEFKFKWPSSNGDSV